MSSWLARYFETLELAIYFQSSFIINLRYNNVMHLCIRVIAD